MEFFELLENGQWLDLFIKYGLDLAITAVAIIIFTLAIGRQIKKKRIISVLFSYFALTVVAVIFEWLILRQIINLVVISLSVLFILLHEGEWRKIFAASKKSRLIIDDDKQGMSQSLYKVMKDLVIHLSAQKTGAIITFERGDDLAEFINEGVAVNAPVTVPMLSTIFYVGTPLHDGAVIIRDDMIVAAAVFYLPTTRAMNGKFGARHRAALGISEQTDAVTVVVSEETGRISFTYQGELIPTSRDSFIADFSDLMER